MRLHRLLCLLSATQPFVYALVSPRHAHSSKVVIPTLVSLENSQAQFTSNSDGLDAPKVTPINATSFDWWYFDAVSLDSNASIVVTFFTSTAGGFALLGDQVIVDSVYVWASFPNGTLFDVQLPATEAIVISDGQGSSGVFNGTGSSWTGASDLSGYLVNIDMPELGVQGKLSLKSFAPAHYACGPVKEGQNLQVSPHIGWANAIPDSAAVVDFTINGSQLLFIGAGYHDKNWGDQPFVQHVGSWFWGHARLGPYSLVWFDVLDRNGTEYVSAYAAHNGRVLASQCSGIKVRPTGANSQYPPLITSGSPDGFHIELDLGSEGILGVNVTNSLAIADAVVYTRWVGSIVGGFNGASEWRGVSLQEEFKFME